MSKPSPKPKKCGACGEAGHYKRSCPTVPYQDPKDDSAKIKAVQRTIVELLESGNFLETAANAAGITTAKCRSWLRLGAEPGSKYAEFRSEVLRAMAASEAEAVRLLVKAAANGNSKLIIQFLERRFPQRWNPDVRTEVNRQLEGILDRIEQLESTIGSEAVEAVIKAILDLDGDGALEQEAIERGY